MSGFSPDWLALRATADARARNGALIDALADWAASRPAPLRILDLGAGTGASLAALGPRLPVGQRWTLADHDAALLAEARARQARGDLPAVPMETALLDLNAPGALERLVAGADLVTASAFFDLCGRAVIERLAAAVARAGAAFWTCLTYDGRETWEPPDADDAAVLEAFLGDQATDKGLGPALGPGATEAMAEILAHHGLKVHRAPSDWVLEAPRDARLIGALAEGSAGAVAPRIGRERAARWAVARKAAQRVVIGHEDLLALPPG